MADNFDEEYCERGEENHLQNGIDSNEDGTVLAVAAGESVPDEHLRYLLVEERHLEGLDLAIAMQRPSPTRMRPSLKPCLSGRKAHASAS